MRDEISKYVSENYEKLSYSALNITKNKINADDLLHITIENILNRKKYSDIVKKCNNFYNYITRAMTLQFYSNTSYYHKTYRIDKPIDNVDFITEEIDGSEEYDYTFEDIIDIVVAADFYETELKYSLMNVEDKMKIVKIKNKFKMKNKFAKTIFLEYYYPDYYLSDLEDYDIEILKKIRKTSYRSVAKPYGFNHTTIGDIILDILYKLEYILKKQI